MVYISYGLTIWFIWIESTQGYGIIKSNNKRVMLMSVITIERIERRNIFLKSWFYEDEQILN